MMVERHFAFFRQRTGEYIREWKGPVSEPDIDPTLVGDARLVAMNAWATDVSQPQPGEVGLDVTTFDYPVGDFCWAVFRQPDHLLDWPATHKFIEINRSTACVFANIESARPIRSTPETLVIDITATPLEEHYGHLFGQLPVATRLALEAARIDVDVVTAAARVLVRR